MPRPANAARRSRARLKPVFSRLAVSARAALRDAALDRAAHTARVAIEADATDPLARVVLARIHLRRSQPAAALEWLAPLADAAVVADFSIAALRVWASVRSGADGTAELVADIEGTPPASLAGEAVDDWLDAAYAAASVGQFSVAGAAFRRVLGAPDAPVAGAAAAALGLAQLRGDATVADVATMRRVAEKADRLPGGGLAESARADARFALGHVADAAGNYEAAAQAYLRANRLASRAHGTHQPDAKAVSDITRRWRGNVKHLINADIPPPLLSAEQSPLPVRPVFIVGLPRSGTTLVEQVLAAHTAVHAAGETPALRRVRTSRGTLGNDYPGCLTRGDVRVSGAFGDAYLSQIGAPPDARVVTDKVPGNFFLLAAVAAGLPGARIVHVRRDALDVCTSIFTTRFANGHAWSYRFADIGAYYAGYRQLMTHWTQTLSLPMLEVHYEALVSDLDTTARTLLDFVGLDAQAACLVPHRSARAQAHSIGSASHWQARQAPTTASVGRFVRYADAFAPLQEALDG